jgi:hypothetical protein
LLIWVVGCAVGFAAYRWITPPHIATSGGLRIVSGYSLVMGMAFGTILTGCGLLAHRRWQGDTSSPSRAGHWLLLLGLAAVPADIAAIVAYNCRAAHDPSFRMTAYLAQFEIGGRGTWPAMYHQAVGWTVGAIAVLGFLCALRRRLQRHWLAVFVVSALASATLAVGHVIALSLAFLAVDARSLTRLLVHVYAGFLILGALAILSAIAWDWRSGVPGDGVHRLGLETWLAIAAIQLVMYSLYLKL